MFGFNKNKKDENLNSETSSTVGLDSLIKKKNTDLNNEISSQSTMKLDSLSGSEKNNNLISNLNKDAEKIQKEPEINLNNFNVPNEINKEKKVIFGDSGIIRDKSQIKKNNYWKTFVIGFFVFIFFGLFSIGFRFYERYLYYSSQPTMDPKYANYVQQYKNSQQFINKYINSTSDYYKNLPLNKEDSTENINKILNTNNLNFVQKKDILQNGLNLISNDLISNYLNLDNLKQDISKYGFFPKEISDVLENEEYITSIKKSILSLEIMKFTSAIQVFSYLDSFISNISQSLGISLSDVDIKMKNIFARGEKDIGIYLNNCYLNPYEVDYDCNLIGDFDRYYNIVDVETKDQIDKGFFKKLISYIDMKLEQTSLPSFSIVFQKFDPKQEQISFSVEVNTFQQDEIALIKKGIINPHVFIITSLLNLLKQSKFVIGENIDVKKLDIQQKTINIGGSNFSFNNSLMNFNLPLQKTVEREITDFVDQNNFKK
ncbi:MAG: hypothetical protein WC872_02530 [Candidatus Absconditabacterales bacterium]